MNEPIRVGIAGLGRSGWNIHASTFQSLAEKYQVVAAMDFDAARREEAATTFGATTYDDYAALVADERVEVVVVATPNFLHRDHVISALENGRHVVCEKPFGTDVGEADAMIEAARKNARLVAPFQNRRYEAHFEKVREIVRSGVLGDIHLIRLCVHNFGRRWDWQTLRKFSGGQLTNWGPHVIDHALQLLGLDERETPEMWVDMRNLLSSGDAEDTIKLVLRKPDGPVIDIELSGASAYAQDRWFIAGKNGGLRGTTSHLEWKWVDWNALPERPVEETPTAGRSYNGEQLEWQSQEWNASGEKEMDLLNQRFYLELYKAVRQGAELDISPSSVRQQIAVIERAKEIGGFA